MTHREGEGSPSGQPLSPAGSGRCGAADLQGLAVAGLLVAAILLSGQFPRPHYAMEPVRRAMVARDLLGGLSRGRQGLVGSPQVAPLPTVLIVLLSLIPSVGPTPAAGCLVAAVAALLLCFHINRLWAGEGISWMVRCPALACLLLSPAVTASIQAGRSTMLFLALVVCGWGFLVRWVRRGALHDLAYAALLLGLSVGVRYQALLIVGVGLVVVSAAALLRRRSWTLVEGTAITFLLPTGYVIALWVGGNWLILGNPVFFLRGLVHTLRQGTVGAGPLLAEGCEWTALGAAALLALSVPVAAALRRGSGGGWLRHGAALGAALAAVPLMELGGAMEAAAGTDSRIPHAIACLQQRHRNAAFVVTGYEGYTFMATARGGRDGGDGGGDPEHYWIHLMHLEPARFRKILRDFRGRNIYLLVNTESTLERWEEMGLEWREPHARVPEEFLYAGEVGPWRVFECLSSEASLLGGRSGGESAAP